MNSFQPLFKKRLWLTYFFCLIIVLVKGVTDFDENSRSQKKGELLFATVSLSDPVRNLQVLFLQPQLPLGLKVQ